MTRHYTRAPPLLAPETRQAEFTRAGKVLYLETFPLINEHTGVCNAWNQVEYQNFIPHLLAAGAEPKGKGRLHRPRPDPVVTDTLLFDLGADGEPDLLLFDVSEGVNVYPGVIARLDNTWRVVIDPECF